MKPRARLFCKHFIAISFIERFKTCSLNVAVTCGGSCLTQRRDNLVFLAESSTQWACTAFPAYSLSGRRSHTSTYSLYFQCTLGSVPWSRPDMIAAHIPRGSLPASSAFQESPSQLLPRSLRRCLSIHALRYSCFDASTFTYDCWLARTAVWRRGTRAILLRFSARTTLRPAASIERRGRRGRAERS